MTNAKKTDFASAGEGEDASHCFKRISVIIANYNHERFIGAAIASALDLDWPDVEVIVVDDGSTDASQNVIESFRDQITAVYQQNATQRVARNRGYAISTGDAVIHLDSDDVLHPSLARRAAAIWRPGVSKVQVLMQRIDEEGRSLGGVIPRLRYVPSPEQLRHWLITTSAYPTPPGSGNIYSRRFLDELFPLDDRCGPATDSACLAAAPILGDVLTIDEPLVYYRIHATNTSDMLAAPDQFSKAVKRSTARHEFRWSLHNGADPVDYTPLDKSRELLQFRVADARFRREPVVPVDDLFRLLRNVTTATWAPGPERWDHRLLVALWSLATLVAPRAAALRLIHWRYGRDR